VGKRRESGPSDSYCARRGEGCQAEAGCWHEIPHRDSDEMRRERMRGDVRCERHVVLIDYKKGKRVSRSMDVASGRSQGGLSACLSTAEFDRLKNRHMQDLDRLS
jgi:hypothetical protein